MDLGYKTLNNLISKDEALQKQAASEIINTKDIKAYQILSEKGEFLFDFIKAKIIKNLSLAVNKENLFNLFEFMKVYSEDFKDFILNSLSYYNSPDIEKEALKLLSEGTFAQKTHIIEYFTKTKNKLGVDFAKKYSNSEFLPLKRASIKLLFEFREKDEFLNSIEILSSNADDYEKLQAVEFLACYGSKLGFGPVFNYLKQAGASEFIASCLLLIKNFEELIREENDDEVLTIFSSLIYNFPDSVGFGEIYSYLEEDGVFEFLMETPENFGMLLIFFLEKKLKLVLENEEYLIDLTKDEKIEAKKLLEKISYVIKTADLNEVVRNSLKSSFKTENLIAVLLADEKNFDDIKTLLMKTSDNEIILCALGVLKELNGLCDELVFEIENKVQNETVKLEIKKFYS